MKLNQLFKVWELGFPAIQGESRFTLVSYLKNEKKIKIFNKFGQNKALGTL